MGFANVQRVIGFLIAASSLMMLPPVLVSWWYHDGTANLFLICAAVLLLAGTLIYLPVRDARRELRLRDGFLIVTSSWLTVVIVGALPFVLLVTPQVTYVDALFESMSGLTTTGATVLTQIETLPRAVLYYRQQLQWLGGLGIIVLAVAVLPVLRIGGMQLYRAEMPGPQKDAKLTPRITETAKALWLIYVGITIACILAFWLGGMTLFDAVCHAFSTVAIGGFSTYDASLSHWNSPTLEAIAIAFMIISGVNFSLHFTAWRRATMQGYFQDPELKAYALLLFAFALLVSLVLYVSGTYTELSSAFRHGTFQAVSAMTTTGFTTASFADWPGFLPTFLVFTAFIGGCAGSTAGGMKVVRVILLYRQALREIRRLIHPNAVIPVRIGAHKTSSSVMDAVWGFFFLFIASFAIATLTLTATGIDAVTAWSAAAACITNLGPGLGEVHLNYAELNNLAKLVLSFTMLLGRLEVYTLLVLFAPAFWRD